MKKILVLEDEERIRNIYKNLLTLEGFDVVEAMNAVDANELLKRENVDLVLLDIKMPKIDGSVMFDVIQQFHRYLKVIVTSVYPLHLQKRILPGATDYHDKSHGINILLNKIKMALENEQSNEEGDWV